MFKINFNFGFPFLILLAVLGCGAKEELVVSSNEMIVGTWHDGLNRVRILYNIESGDTTATEYSNFTITFNADGSFFTENAVPRELSRKGTWEFDADKNKIIFEMEPSFINTFGYIETHEFQIKELTESKMRVRYTKTWALQGNSEQHGDSHFFWYLIKD